MVNHTSWQIWGTVKPYSRPSPEFDRVAAFVIP